MGARRETMRARMRGGWSFTLEPYHGFAYRRGMLALAAAALVVCAPGSPGNTEEAQPAMDALARSLERAAHLLDGEVAAAYEETEAGCSRRRADKHAGMVLAHPPFFLWHEEAVRGVPRL